MLSKIFDTGKGRHIWPERTICEVHREIYDLLVAGLWTTNQQLLYKIIPLLEEAYIDGIKMTKKLVDNKCSFPDWEKNLPSEEVIRLRKLRIHLTEELNR